jgi:hypothetical protein
LVIRSAEKYIGAIVIADVYMVEVKKQIYIEL